MTLANILHAKAQRLIAAGGEGNAVLGEALLILKDYKPEYGHDQEVADSIASKIYRALGRWDDAHRHVSKYNNNDNPYTIYERCKIDQRESETLAQKDQPMEALEIIRRAQQRIQSYRQKRELPLPLHDLKLLLEADAARIRYSIEGRQE